MDNSSLFSLSYGLYVLTARHDGKDNGCIINTAMQITSNPPIIGLISVNKQNRTHAMIMNTNKFNVSALDTETPFDLIKHFGMQSGAAVDKFAIFRETDKSKDGNLHLKNNPIEGDNKFPVLRSKNGILHLKNHANAYLSFEVLDTVDFGSHTVFKAEIVDGEVIGKSTSLTYAYYHQFIKPKPQAAAQHGYRCIFCGYIHGGESLPEDFVCPLCKHGAIDFIKLS